MPTSIASFNFNFNSFTANTLIKSAEMNANFAGIALNFSAFTGDLIPVDPTSPGSANNTYDLGTPEYYWQEGFIGRFDMLNQAAPTAPTTGSVKVYANNNRIWVKSSDGISTPLEGNSYAVYQNDTGQVLTNGTNIIDYATLYDGNISTYLTITVGASWTAEAILDFTLYVKASVWIDTSLLDSGGDVRYFLYHNTGTAFTLTGFFERYDKDYSSTENHGFLLQGSHILSMTAGDRFYCGLFNGIGASYTMSSSGLFHELELIALGRN